MTLTDRILIDTKHPLRYLIETERGFPKRISYRVIAGDGNLHPICLTDAIFDKRDLKMRQLI